jgi:ppGpp synthetase/RelA/SpoT-type nucleotidyltranferase
MITYDDVKSYRVKLENPLTSIIQNLEKEIISNRNNADIALPIALTKWRIKSVDSIYLKVKRKSKTDLSDITDYGGLRILCMFEQDILPVHEFLVDLLSRDDFKLKEFKIFNWTNKRSIELLERKIKKCFKDFEFDNEERATGYKSIHYVVSQIYGVNSYPIEIQLRTLLQDVWGELDHTIAYKQGNIHPHIGKSFSLLARDLETNDLLISHLRDIRDKEREAEMFSLRNTGPYKPFDYEEHIFPEIFKEEGELKSTAELYQAHLLQWNPEGDIAKWIAKGHDLYVKVDSLINYENRSLPEVEYWSTMEDAFFYFVSGDHDSAHEKYQSIINKGSNRYVPHFRIGEIEFIRGNITKSLLSFDRAEECMELDENHDKHNAYMLKVVLANTYWLMGSDYCNISVAKILEAESIFHANSGLFNEHDKRSLINNLCWYHLEKYIKSKSDEDYREALDRYMALEEVMGGEAEYADDYDTAAWFCYHAYLKSGDQDFLGKAKSYCEKGVDKHIYARHAITSANMYRNHVQEIMSIK